MRWADTTQGARTDRKEVREIEHPALGVEERPHMRRRAAAYVIRRKKTEA